VVTKPNRKLAFAFPNKVSCLRRVLALLSEISEEYLTGKTNIYFEGSTLSQENLQWNI
jgi:hypothetical protein